MEFDIRRSCLERFLRYVKIDTQSDNESLTIPSTKKQLNLIKLLKEELKQLGINSETDSKGYLYARLGPVNNKQKVGFIAHVDTSPDESGKNVKPTLHKNYKGQVIKLSGVEISPKEFPVLNNYKGQTIITSGGTTLLGADDKAGVAEIMTLVEYFSKNKSELKIPLRIAFTVDEEIGRGGKYFDIKRFDSNVAYTVDGGEVGELEYECFNASTISITVIGENIHPGEAKGKLVNSMLIANELIAQIPKNEVPEKTSGRQGFYHLTDFKGDVSKTTLNYIIRDFEILGLNSKKKMFEEIVKKLNKKYEDRVSITVKDQYFNMKNTVKERFFIVENAKKAMKKVNIKPKIKPIRGGTDGAMLSARGLPCPNIFAGGHNFHSKKEYVPLESMEKAVLTLINLVEIYGNE